VDLRMGIHTGDIIIEDEESTAMASISHPDRITAVPGGIFISEKVNDEIKSTRY
jgi:hypothetical protein